MNCAPLNLAHFHERRADKLIKRHRYDEAFKAIETSLLYVDDAYKHVKIPKALEVLDTQKWEYKRKLNRIQMQKLQHEKLKSKEIVPVQVEMAPNNIKTDANAQSIARSIDKTVKEFNDKYGSTLLENIQEIKTQAKESNDFINCNEQKPTKLKDNSKGVLNEHIEINIGRLSLIDIHLQSTDDDLPILAPLELPSFDYVFTMASEEENSKK